MSFKIGWIRKKRCQIFDDLIPVLYQVYGRDQFSNLTWLIDNLYDYPKIDPKQSQLLAEEIEALVGLLISLHLPLPLVVLQRLKLFFIAAADHQQIIYIKSK